MEFFSLLSVEFFGRSCSTWAAAGARQGADAAALSDAVTPIAVMDERQADMVADGGRTERRPGMSEGEWEVGWQFNRVRNWHR